MAHYEQPHLDLPCLQIELFLAHLYQKVYVQGDIVTLTLVSAWAWVSHFKFLCQSFLYVMGKVLSDELCCTRRGVVIFGTLNVI